MIKFLDLLEVNSRIKKEISVAVERVTESGWYVLASECSTFETNYAAFCDSKQCVGVANGLDALVLSLRALDIGVGDEVIVPAHTFVATWLAVSQVGATPVAVDVCEHNFAMDPKQIEKLINPRTKAIIPVHLYGHPADLDPILEIATNHNLKVIEDAAQAHGARYKQRRIGAHSDLVCWSFYPGKNLGALGDGGAITTDNAVLADRLRVLRNYGAKQKYEHIELGTNSRLDELQAAILNVKLISLDFDNAHRNEVANIYNHGLCGKHLILPKVDNDCDHAWHLYVVLHPKRDELRDLLFQAGIETGIHYPIAPHRQEAYRGHVASQHTYPSAEKMVASCLSLPIGPTLSRSDVASVVSAVNLAIDKIEAKA